MIRDATKHSQFARAHAIAKQACFIGIENPSQPTLFRMVSLVAWGESNFEMSQAEVFNLMDKIQSLIKGFRKPDGLSYLETYPVSASQLTPAMQALCYPDSKLPIDITIPDLDTILMDKKQRGRGKLDSFEDESWLQSIPEKYKMCVLAAMQTEHRRTNSSSGTAVQVFKDFSSAYRKRDRDDNMLLPGRAPCTESAVDDDALATGARCERAGEGVVAEERDVESVEDDEAAKNTIEEMENELAGATKLKTKGKMSKNSREGREGRDHRREIRKKTDCICRTIQC